MSDDECPDFDQTLRNMLATPRVPHVKPVEGPEETELSEEEQKWGLIGFTNLGGGLE